MTQPNILIVDDDPGAVQVLAGILGDLGELFVATHGAEALEIIAAGPPDLVLLDANMPGLSGFDVCARLKADPATAEIPVIFITATGTADSEVSGFDAGAVDFITKPVVSQTVRARVKTQLKLKQLADELRQSATRDALTGLGNRRRFDEMMVREVAIAHRSGTPLTLMIFDIDHFKAYNDHYGHPQGDACLRSVALAIADACLRPADLVARIGGEEFAALLPQTLLADSATVAMRVLDAVAALALPHRGVGPSANVSLSLGAATLMGLGRRGAVDASLRECGAQIATEKSLSDRLVRIADLALYEAKRAGRNRAYAAEADAAGTSSRQFLLAMPSPQAVGVE